MSRCNRCQWRSDPEAEEPEREQLAVHAVDAEHPVCLVDGFRSLTLEEARVCEKCIARCRQQLAELVQGYTLLPAQLGHPKPVILDRDGGRTSDGRPLPGGNALVMLAPGSAGAFGDDTTTSHPDDPESIPDFLATIEDDWRHTRGEPAAIVAGGRGDPYRTVTEAAGYIETRMRWAANQHPDFHEFATRLRDIRDAVLNVNSMLEHPETAPARCLDCNGRLVRGYRPASQCDHGPIPTELEDQELPLPGAKRNGKPVPGPYRRPLTELRRILAQQQAKWRRDHGYCDQGGLEPNAICRNCGREYEPAEYWLAVAEGSREEAS